jgi:hypothetical protein
MSVRVLKKHVADTVALMNSRVKVVYNSKRYSCSDLHIADGENPACGRTIEAPMFFEDSYYKVTDLMCRKCKDLAAPAKG